MSVVPKLIINKIINIRKKGLVIGFTNGCFDLLHEGHKFFLLECKKNCDFLIVGLNSDSSVKELKGSDRPIDKYKKRVENLENLKSVDEVLIFDELTPLSLIEQIKPDVLMKGEDYNINQIIGRDFVIANGGSIKLIKFLQGYSTSQKIREMKN